MANVTIYSTPTCHFCHMAKEFFQENDIKFTEKDVAADLEARKEMVDKTGQMGVPVIDIDGDLVVGYDRDYLANKLGVKA